MTHTADNKGGIRKSELVAWYLDQIQEQIDSEEELLDHKNYIEKIIDRLTYHVRIRIYVNRILCISLLPFEMIYRPHLDSINS